MFIIREIKSKRDLKKFINMQWDIYKGDRNFVPPLKKSLFLTLRGKDNPLLSNGPHTFFIAEKDGKVVGRIMAGVNEKLNRSKNKNEGYISLFECINDEEVAFSLFDHAFVWLGGQGADTVVGPVSPTNGDDNRGLLIKGFDGPPVLMNSYNPPYYETLFNKYGFEKDMDLYAFHLDAKDLDDERYGRVSQYAMKKFNFRIDRFDKRFFEREISDIKRILDVSMPDTWEHLTPPSLEEIRKESKNLVRFMDEDLVYIARSGEKPIGFIVALPDYNQVLAKLNGRLLPFGIIKFLWYKRKINRARIFMQFVVPEFRNRAVNSAIYYKLMIEGKKKGYVSGEGSTIAEMNRESILNVQKLGGKLYRVYRIYRKQVQDIPSVPVI
jgi:hypothetical protein